jgi:hypothetical protein
MSLPSGSRYARRSMLIGGHLFRVLNKENDMNLDWKTMTLRQRKWLLRGGIAVGLFCSIAITGIYGNLAGRALQTLGVVETKEAVVNRHLSWAELESMSAIESGLLPIKAFFVEARQHTRPYAEKTLSFDSKWKMVTDFVTNKGDHPRFLRDKFDEIVFSQPQLNQLVESVVANYIRHLEDVESQMLVRMKADLANMSEDGFSGSIDQQSLAAALDGALRAAVAASQGDLQASVGLEIASWIAGEIIGQAAVQLATSSGIIGTGAAAGPMSFGLTLVVGLAIDQVISEIYNQAYDPVGELSRTLNGHLTTMEQLVLEGKPDAPGLITRLGQFSTQRGTARREAIRSAVLTQSF